MMIFRTSRFGGSHVSPRTQGFPGTSHGEHFSPWWVPPSDFQVEQLVLSNDGDGGFPNFLLGDFWDVLLEVPLGFKNSEKHNENSCNLLTNKIDR